MLQNKFSKTTENNASFIYRFYLYQKERFPFLMHGLLVTCISFSAIAFSRISRGATGFVDLKTFIIGVSILLSFFFLVRVFDEFKDAEDDAQFRTELPVPRGLISLRELGWIGILILILQLGLNTCFFPKMLPIYGILLAYLLLLRKEFFIPAWLKKHQFWYVTSHMFLMPLVMLYASGLDWKLADLQPTNKAFFFFLALSYTNGILLEIGRKIRSPEKESEGVLTYSWLLGANKATLLWLLLLLLTLSLSIAASAFAGYGMTAWFILGLIFLLCTIPAFLFLRAKTPTLSKAIEYASAAWTLFMYLTLGLYPYLV